MEAVGQVLSATALAHGLHIEGLVFRNAGLYAIQNTRACTKPQGMHTDYGRVMVQHLHGTHLFPRSAIWAVHAPFRLGTRDYGDVTVRAGHVIFFRADFWHCGGPFVSEQLRFHGFQMPADVGVPQSVYT